MLDEGGLSDVEDQEESGHAHDDQGAKDRPPGGAQPAKNHHGVEEHVGTDLTVLENIALGQPFMRTSAVWYGLGARLSELRAASLSILAPDGLGERISDRAGTLSYGQRRLVELARASLSDARLVLLDEPFAGLDRPHASRVVRMLDQLRREGRSLLVVSHVLPEGAAALFDRHLQIGDGHLLEPAAEGARAGAAEGA